MLEQSLINPNFAGRDGFKWFIGIVANTTPDRADNEYGYRVQVRIIGYHDGKIADKNLPWAHVLVPLNMGTGAGGAGVSHNIRGSEVVIGFFADGDDAQQPIIIGGLYSGASTEYLNTFNNGTKQFKLFSQKPGAIINPQNIPIKNGASQPPVPSIPKPLGTVGKGGDQSQANNQLHKYPTVSIPGHCKTGKDILSQINKGLIKFIQLLNEVKYINNTYINPILNRITDIGSEIQEIASIISDALSTIIKKIRDEIINGIYNLLKDLLKQLKLPSPLEIAKKIATDKIVDGIWCVFLKILKRVEKFVFNFLMGMIGKVVSIPTCMLDAFTGSIIQSVANEIEDAIGPALEEVASVLGGAIGTVMSVVETALGYAKIMASFLQCEDSPCKEVFDYEMNKGFVPKTGDLKFQSIINYSPAQGVRNLLDDGTKHAEKFFGGISGGDLPDGAKPLVGDCNYTSLECGFPIVNIFGGGGSGATGNAVVDAFGQILGVNITNPGGGYTSVPYISFLDPCNYGSGAKGTVILTNGKVSGVRMDDPGSGYLGPNTDNVDQNVDDETLIKSACSIAPAESSGAIVTATISNIVIQNTGIGYSSNDVIINTACPDSDVLIKPKLDDDGRVIGVDIVNSGTSINIFPELTINSETGGGAVLVPVLSFSKEDAINTNTELQTAIYCADKI